MARKLRIQYPGAIYHVMNRGDRREAIFADDQDRQRLLETLAEACEKTQWQVHAYCLMSNHFHLVVETPQPNLVAGMKWLLGTYTSRYNRRHQEFGHLFSGRYKALVVDGSGNGYLKTACDYVHLNPARAALLSPEQALSGFLWSSYPHYLRVPSVRPAWLRMDRLLGEWGIPRDTAAGRREFEKRMEWRRREGAGQEFKPLERGWCLGSEQFRRELLEQVSTPAGPVSLWGGGARGGGGACRAIGDRGPQGTGLDPRDAEDETQRRFWQSEVGARGARQDNDAASLDCGAAVDGQPGTWRGC